MAKFSWPAYPSSEAEFEQLMTADKTLAAQDLRPFQRTLHVGRLFWEVSGWSGRVMKRKALPHQDSGPARTYQPGVATNDLLISDHFCICDARTPPKSAGQAT